MSEENGGLLLFGGFEVDVTQFDLNDHSSRVKSIKITNIVFIALIALIVGLRIATRALFVRKIFADDILIILAAGFTIALASVGVAATMKGLGQHVWHLSIATVLPTIKTCILYLYVSQVLYACAIALTKFAIIASYLRFIQNATFTKTMYALSIVIAGQWVTGVLVTVFQCTPVQGAWDFTIESRKCITYINYLYASSAINVTTDILLCVLPWPYLWRLKVPKKQRIILCMLFTGGISACAACIARIGHIHNLANLDTTYHSVPALNLSVGECGLGIICVSIPALRPLFQRIFPIAFRSEYTSHYGSRGVPLNEMTPRPGVSIVEKSPKEDTSSASDDESALQLPLEQPKNWSWYHAK